MATCPACGKENPDGFQFCGFCTAPLTGDSREQRKTVTVLFCDVTGSTALGESTDPEALRALLARYFERMKAIVESHGGTVEKFIGDAVMAVFGIPQAHEDDALRACRAAVEMRDALPELGIRGRIGVNTGEVVTGTSERLATGDAVNVAARFEQAAEPGEVLIGEPTHALVHEAVEAEPVEPLTLKGKMEPVVAYRLVSVLAAAERSHDARFVGRERELEVISAAWMRAGAEQRCELVTVVGEAGVGKSRLVAEALAGLDTKVVRGRCPPYGEGITYWPVVEVVKQLGELPSDPVAAEAIRALLGESERGASADEIAWAFRKLLEEQAPLVVVFDDLQWGEETFLDLVEATSLLSAEAPLLFLCMARPELVERRPSWSAPLRLQPLGAEDAVALIGDAVSGEQRERIAQAAGGNPLFITEMLAMAGDDADVDVPPTLKALLAMRLDQLGPEERRVLECGSVEGEIFHRGGVQALAVGERQVTTRLAALVRRQLIQTEHAQLVGEDGYRFRHLLIRDAAYEALPKATRAELHERFAAWLEGHGQDLVELDEILGYHLEQAHRSRAELGQIDDEVAQRAARALAKAGLRAHARGDMPAATNLLERAVALLRAEDVLRLQILPELGIALTETGELTRAAAVLDEAIAAGRSQGDARVEHSARAQRALLQAQVDPEHSLKARQDVQEAIEVLDALEDHGGLARAWYAAATFAHWSSHASEAEAACEHAFEHADQAGDRRLAADALWRLCTVLVLGPTPAAEAERRIAELADRAGGDRKVEAASHGTRAPLVAMQGRFDEARAHRDRALALNEELGLRLYTAGVTHYTGYVEVLAGDLAAAAAEHRASADLLRGMGAKAYLSATLGFLAEIVCAEGRDDEALALTTEAEALRPEIGIRSRSVRAQVLARRGEQAEAESLAREACALADSTDYPDERAAARSALAEVLRLAGRPHEAAAEAELALRLYESKGNLVMAKRARGRVAELQKVSPRQKL